MSQQELTQILSDLKEIKECLLGNEYTKKGLVERVEDAEKWIRNIDLMKAKIYGGAIVISTIIPVGMTLLINYFTK